MKKSAAAVFLLCATLAMSQVDPGETTIHIVSLTFIGADEIPAKDKTEITLDIKSSVTKPGQLGEELGDRIRDEFQRRGYFKALIQHPTVMILGGDKVNASVAIQVEVDAGLQYRLGHISFTGEKAFDPVRLRAAIPISDGEIFSVEGIRQGLKAMRDLYCSRGYINFTPVPNTDIDETHKLVNLTFDMDEGQQYLLGKLVLNGEEPYAGAGKKLLDTWKSHQGHVYRCDLARDLYQEGAAAEMAAIDPVFQAAVHAGGKAESHFNNQTATVDFLFNFPDPK